MTTQTIKSAKELKSFLKENRKNLTCINGVKCGEVYPIIIATNKGAHYYDVNEQQNFPLIAPFIVEFK